MYDSLDDLETSREWKFKGHPYFAAGLLSARETFEDEVLAAVEQQYLPAVSLPVHHMKMYYNTAAEPDRELLKLLI